MYIYIYRQNKQKLFIKKINAIKDKRQNCFQKTQQTLFISSELQLPQENQLAVDYTR